MTSLRVRGGAVATAIGAVMVLTLEVPPAVAHSVAQPELVPDDTPILSSVAQAGGTGRALAYWRNAGRQTTVTDARIEALAPENQVFRPTGRLILRTSPDGAQWEGIRPTARVDQSCELSDEGRAISCTLPAFTLEGGSRLSIGFSTFVAPSAAVTSDWTSTSGATLTVEGATMRASLKTFVGSRSTSTNRVVRPGAGERTVGGEAHPGSRIELSGPPGIAGNSTTGRNGEWSVTLPEGFGMVQVRFVDVSGEVYYAEDFYYNSYVFSASSDVTASAGLHGRGQPDSMVEVLDHEGGNLGSLRVPTEARWRLDLPVPESIGHDLTIVNTLSDGSVTRLHIRMNGSPAEATLNLTRHGQSPPKVDGSVHTFVVQLLDGAREPITGSPLEFTIHGDGDLTIARAVSDRNGEASFTIVSDVDAAFVINARALETGSEAAIIG